MAELKTKPTKENVVAFLKTIEPAQKQADSLVLLKLFENVTGEKAVMWGETGTRMIGFGMYHYKSERSRQQGDWPLVAFSARKQNLTLYIMHGNHQNPLLKKLGKHKTSAGSCLYLNKLADVDLDILKDLIRTSYETMKKTGQGAYGL